MKHRPIFAICILILPSAATAERWRIAGATTTGIMFVDEDSIRRNGTQVRFWMDTWVRDALPSGDNRMVALYEADCRDMRWAEIQVSFMRDEQEISTTQLRPNFLHLAPGTVQRRALEAVCSGNYRTSEPVQDRGAMARILFERVR